MKQITKEAYSKMRNPGKVINLSKDRFVTQRSRQFDIIQSEQTTFKKQMDARLGGLIFLIQSISSNSAMVVA